MYLCVVDWQRDEIVFRSEACLEEFSTHPSIVISPNFEYVAYNAECAKPLQRKIVIARMDQNLAKLLTR
jgi:hypothetical protein